MTRGPTVSLLVLLAIAIGLAVLLLADDTAEGPRTAPRPAEAAFDPVDTETHAIDDVVPFPEVETDVFDEEDEARAAPESVAETPRWVRVFDAAGAPAAGAIVRLVREGQDRDERRRAWIRSTPAAPYRVMRTMSDGRAPLHPLPRSAFRIEAWTDRSFGAMRFALPRKQPETAPLEVRLALRSSPRIDVRVRQDDGTPARAVRVEIHPDYRVKHRWDDRVCLWTDDDGFAAHRLTFENRWARPGTPVYATVRLLNGRKIVSDPVRATKDGDYDFDLTVPRMGAVNVKLTLPSGGPWKGRADLTWWRITDHPKKRSLGRITAYEGRAVISAVPPGERIVLRIKAHGREDALHAIDILPTGAPQDAVCEIGRCGAKLSMILTTADGVPLPKHRFRARVVQSDDDAHAARIEALDPAWRQRRDRSIRTGRRGQVELTLRPGSSGAVMVFFETPNKKRSRSASSQPEPAPQAVIDFPPLEDESAHDVGPIPLPAYRLLAEGVVVDSEGDPVKDARVSVWLDPPPTGKSSRSRRRVVSLAVTDKEGAFAVLGVSPGPGDLLVDAKTRDGVVEAVPIGLGARDLRLRLQRYGSLAGRVTAADRSLPLRIDLRMEREDLPKPQRVGLSRDRDGRLKARGLVPGLYRVRVWAAGIPAIDLHGIRIPEGETVVPPALADVIIGQSFRAGRVVVRDEYGVPMPKVKITTRERNVAPAARNQSLSTDATGEAVLAWRSGVELDVVVHAPGWRRRFKNPAFPLNVVVGDSTAPVAKKHYRNRDDAPPLIVLFDAPLPRYAPIKSYTLVMTQVGDYGGRPPKEVQTVRTRPDRALYNSVPPGTYDAALEIRLDKSAANGRGGRVYAQLGRTTVLGTPRERIRIRVDLAAIDHAVRTVR